MEGEEEEEEEEVCYLQGCPSPRIWEVSNTHNAAEKTRNRRR